MLDLTKPILKWHPDDEAVDEIRIRLIPRYKTSGLSGNEWRVSAKVEVFDKGQLVCERSFGTMAAAAQLLPSVLLLDREAAKYAEVPERESYCFQPGCQRKAVSTYTLKDAYCHREGQKLDPRPWKNYRRFCQRHLRRGDCGLEDADANYIVETGPGPDEAIGWEGAESPSAGPIII